MGGNMNTITMMDSDIQGAKTLQGVPMTTWIRILNEFAASPDQEIKIKLHFRTVWAKAYSSLYSSNRLDTDGVRVIVPIYSRYDDLQHAVILTKKGSSHENS